MNTAERKQIRLILETSLDNARRKLDADVKALYANASAKHTLKSGNTLRRLAALLESSGEVLISKTLDDISAVAMDNDAFRMFGDVFDQFLNSARRKFEADKLIETISRDGAESSAIKAFWKLVDDAVARLERQKDIRAFSFTQPAPSRKAETRKVVSNTPIDSNKKRGGRPPADWWDDLWIEIFRQIHIGDLKPKTQADITRAMADYLATRGIAGNDSTLKPRARKLFAMLEQLEAE